MSRIDQLEHSGCGRRSLDIRVRHRSCQGSFVGYEASHLQVMIEFFVICEIIDIPLSRTEYITIISIMVCMTVWDFVVGVLFGIIVSCKCQTAMHLFIAVLMKTTRQVSSSSFRILNGEASVHYILANLLCRQCGDLASSGHISAKSQNTLRSSGFKVCIPKSHMRGPLMSCD